VGCLFGRVASSAIVTVISLVFVVVIRSEDWLQGVSLARRRRGCKACMLGRILAVVVEVDMYLAAHV